MVSDILIICGVLLLIAILCLGITAFVIARKLHKQFDQTFSQDVSKLQAKAGKFSKKHPDCSDEEIIDLVIKSESKSAGVIGFFTGLGGLLTLPIALPLDMITTIKIQKRLAEYIMNHNVERKTGFDADKAKTLAILFGANKASKLGAKFAISLIVKYTPQVLMRSVPILGGVVGFLTDYYGTKGVAKYAKSESLKMINTN